MNVHRSIIHNSKKVENPKCPSMDEGTNEMWYSHPKEYYSVIEGNEVLIHATTWIGLENVMLSERSQIQKATYCLI